MFPHYLPNRLRKLRLWEDCKNWERQTVCLKAPSLNELSSHSGHSPSQQTTHPGSSPAGRTYKINKQRSSSESGEISTFSMQCQFLLLWSFSFTPWSSINMIQYYCSINTSQMRKSGRERNREKRLSAEWEEEVVGKEIATGHRGASLRRWAVVPRDPDSPGICKVTFFPSFFFKVTFSSSLLK